MVRVARLHAALGTAAVAAPLALSGCGDDDGHANRPRPPAPIVVTASVARDEVSVSPARIGAGPISLIVTNQTARSQQVTLERVGAPGGDRGRLRQTTGPINPRDTAQLDADVPEGTYAVRVDVDGVRPATIDVGAPRPSAQQDLMLP
ncbi:MAG: hypothetical protein IRZ32_04005 [Solirubrobacteraceae bacterium]|nr:hypothetical protein [Solirubrobacteraceae bacterium]